MPLYDTTEDRLVLRIVYDGPGVAGKTTNVERLSADFDTASASELFDGGRIADRTQFFECMHVDGGLVEGCRLRTLFVTVPGQEELRERRLALLDGADAVVFVCDSSADGMPRAREMYDDLCQHLRGMGRAETPIVIQANKQDRPGALDTGRVARALGSHPSIAVVPARAISGIGVRETAVLAARAAAANTRASIARLGFASVARQSTSPEQLLESVRSLSAGAENAAVAMPVLHALADLASAAERGPKAPRRLVLQDVAGPSLPTPELPVSSIWPAGTGQEVLRGLSSAGVAVVRAGAEPGSTGGSADDIVFEMGPWRLQTSRQLRFTERLEAERALLAHAERSLQLDRLLPPRNALFLTTAKDGAYWLWSVRPWLRTLEDRLIGVSRDFPQFELELQAYANAAIDALGVAVGRSLLLDLAPFQLATLGARVVYLGLSQSAREVGPTMTQSLLDNLLAWGAGQRLLDACREQALELSRHS